MAGFSLAVNLAVTGVKGNDVLGVEPQNPAIEAVDSGDPIILWGNYIIRSY